MGFLNYPKITEDIFSNRTDYYINDNFIGSKINDEIIYESTKFNNNFKHMIEYKVVKDLIKNNQNVDVKIISRETYNSLWNILSAEEYNINLKKFQKEVGIIAMNI